MFGLLDECMARVRIEEARRAAAESQRFAAHAPRSRRRRAKPSDRFDARERRDLGWER
jgi:hypothetical protein